MELLHGKNMHTLNFADKSGLACCTESSIILDRTHARPIAAGLPVAERETEHPTAEAHCTSEIFISPKILPPRLANRGCEVILMDGKTDFLGPENSLPEPTGLGGKVVPCYEAPSSGFFSSLQSAYPSDSPYEPTIRLGNLRCGPVG